MPVDDMMVQKIEEKTRGLIKCGGVHFADVHQNPVVPHLADQQVGNIRWLLHYSRSTYSLAFSHWRALARITNSIVSV